MQGYQPKPSSALAITALVLTILGLLTAIFMVGGLLGLVGLILAIVALAKIKKGNASGKGMAITSTILGTLVYHPGCWCADFQHYGFCADAGVRRESPTQF